MSSTLHDGSCWTLTFSFGPSSLCWSWHEIDQTSAIHLHPLQTTFVSMLFHLLVFWQWLFRSSRVLHCFGPLFTRAVHAFYPDIVSTIIFFFLISLIWILHSQDCTLQTFHFVAKSLLICSRPSACAVCGTVIHADFKNVMKVIAHITCWQVEPKMHFVKLNWRNPLVQLKRNAMQWCMMSSLDNNKRFCSPLCLLFRVVSKQKKSHKMNFFEGTPKSTSKTEKEKEQRENEKNVKECFCFDNLFVWFNHAHASGSTHLLIPLRRRVHLCCLCFQHFSTALWQGFLASLPELATSASPPT